VCGTVFAFSFSSGEENVVHAFTGNVGPDGAGPAADLVALNGTLYGTTFLGGGKCGCGTIFAIDLSTGAESIVHQFKGGKAGSTPNGLIVVGGSLYGTARNAGTNCGSNCGSIFKYTP
jgi:uncharacterized repeat protein (TIGR03803 family)